MLERDRHVEASRYAEALQRSRGRKGWAGKVNTDTTSIILNHLRATPHCASATPAVRQADPIV